METIRKVSKRYYLRQIVIWALVNVMFFGLPFGAFANPNPASNTVPNPDNVLVPDSTVSLDWSGDALNPIIGTATGNNIIGWKNFDIGSNASLTFTQNGGWILNNVKAIDGMATGIRGGLFAENCGLIVRNPLGVTFGPESFVDAQSFVATTLSMNLDAFMNSGFDPLNFEYGALGEVGGDIELQRDWIGGWGGYWDQAEIEVDQTVALIGRNIINKGLIRTTQPDARVLMAAGERVLLSLQGTKVMVDVTAPVPGDFVVKNESGGGWGEPDGKIDAPGAQVVLAAGDIYSTAIEGVEALRATATGTAVFNGPIRAVAGPGSDAVAEVEITTGGDLTIDHDITANAVGNGVDNASATINIHSDGDLTIESGSFGQETELLAEASDGANNNAEVSLEAAGALTINAPDKVTVKAEAGSGEADSLVNQANVNIKGSSVLITGTDYGVTDEPATVKAYAHDAMTNQAVVDIEATEGDVEIIGQGYNGDSAIVLAKAKNGSESSAEVNIKAAEDVKIIAKDGVYNTGDDTTKALVLAKAENADVSNEANVKIEAGGDVKIIGKGGNLDEWQTLNTPESWDVTVKKFDHYTITVKQRRCGMFGCYWVEDEYDTTNWYIRPGWTYVSHETHYEYSTYNTTNPYWYWDLPHGWDYYSNEHNEAIYDDHSSFTPNVAAVLAIAIAENAGSSNTAGVDITAGKDVLVLGKDGGVAQVIASAKEGYENFSDVTINSNGDVKVLAIDGTCSTEDGFTESKALVKAKAQDGLDNTATVGIDAIGGDVLVLGTEGGEAAITALAKNAIAEQTNTATVTINATSEEFTKMVKGEGEGELIEYVYTKGGDVKVIGKEGGEAEIEALAIDGITNNADVLICIDGGVTVKGDRGGEAEIEALAIYGCTNNASVGIGAKGENGVEVIADRGGEAGISSKAKDGFTNTASTIVCTGGDVEVKALRGGDAEILSQAKYGLYNDAYTGIGAMGDVVVQTGEYYEPGCDAVIRAEAETGDICFQQRPDEDPIITTADAEVVVFSHEGNVEVRAYNHGHSGIEAEAQGAHLNDAKVGVAAGADLLPSDVAIPDYPNGDTVFLSVGNFDMLPLSGNVIVEAECGSEAQILAWAHDAASVYEYPDSPVDDVKPTSSEIEVIEIPGENTAKTVICAPGEVVVKAGEGSEARIKSKAGWYGDGDAINTATTKVYASDVKVDVSSLHHGQGIWAYAYGEENNPHTPSHYCMTQDGEVAVTDGAAVLFVQDYSKKTDCPDCPPCPCEEVQGALAPAAPMSLAVLQSSEDCPLLVQAATEELTGAGEAEAIDIVMENALAVNPDINPCQACAMLLDSAGILADPDGSRMAALAAVVGSVAAPDQPFDPAAELMIAAAIAENADSAENTQYAFAGEFVDALVDYVAAAADLGIPAADGRELVMAKYGAALEAPENANVRAYVEARLAALQ